MAASLNVPDMNVWGNLFGEGSSDLLTEINSSVRFDYRLIEEDIEGSIAHVRMLGHVGALPAQDAAEILAGLRALEAQARAGELHLDPSLEDVHMNVEDQLRQLIGPVAGRLHTARSRNDQVALDAKMWARRAEARLDRHLALLIDTLSLRAAEFAEVAMPGFTHLQAAQPVSFGHHLLAYVEMFLRDRDRIRSAHTRADESPLGAAALAGTSHAIDPFFTAEALGFSSPMCNSIDAVSDRDFMLDLLATGSILATHLSRLGEELVLWSTAQFGYVRLPAELAAGSSIMPQKRNPDVAELIRAKSGRVIGNLVALLTVLKGLPLAYSRDLQEDKEALFDTVDTLDVSLRSAIALMSGLTVDTARMAADATVGNTLATDVADWLVVRHRLPFREAHLSVAQLVRSLSERGQQLHEADPAWIRAFAPIFGDLPDEVLTLEHSLASRTSPGGTAPASVRAAAEAARARNHSLIPLPGLSDDRPATKEADQ